MTHKDAKAYWELHVTMEGLPRTLKQKVESVGWKFSAIDGDPILGAGVKCYATSHLNKKVPLEAAIALLTETGSALRKIGCNVTREKVESVDFDRRYS